MGDSNDFIVLIVDDDKPVLDALVHLFEDNYALLTASSGEEAIEACKNENLIAVIIMDIKMPRMNGIEAWHVIRNILPDTKIIFHTGYPGDYDENQIDSEEEPFDSINKFEPLLRLERSVKNAYNAFKSEYLNQTAIFASGADFGMIGNSPQMQRVYNQIAKTAPTDAYVMILGETGTGKELVAHAIHNYSNRKDRNIVIFNCNHRAIELVEPELFGYKKGAFTGAYENRIGIFEYGNGSTVFLDEIGDLDITTQEKILRIVETGKFYRVGEPGVVRDVDVRIICATHRDLEQGVKEGRFREDLFYRLNKVMIRLPALRERKEDIPALVNHFTDRFTVQAGQMPKIFDSSAMEVLSRHDWPGNVRELMGLMESLIIMTDSGIITGHDVELQLGLEPRQQATVGNPGLSDKIENYRRDCIVDAISRTDKNINAAARLLKVDPANLRKWIKKYNIDVKRLSSQTFSDTQKQ